MNTGQTMLTIMAMTLLSVITMSYYSSVGQSGRTLSRGNASFAATTVATSFLERVEGCQFDEYSDTIALLLPDSNKFTAPGQLGITSAEVDSGQVFGSIDTYDDVDDFKGTSVSYNFGLTGEVYQVYFDVYYVNPWGDAYTKVNAKTFLKRIDVKVWRTFPPSDLSNPIDTVKMSTLRAFYFLNPV
jgi:hypothetical protein